MEKKVKLTVKNDDDKSHQSTAIYQNVYVDVVNQVLQMALFARELFFSKKNCRDFFQKINGIHVALQSQDGFIDRYHLEEQRVETLLGDFYLNDSRRSLNKMVKRYQGEKVTFQQQLEEIYHYGLRGELRPKPKERVVADCILLDLLAYYDGNQALFTDDYCRFFKELCGVGNGFAQSFLGGYGHHNIYFILFFFKKIMKDLFVVEEQMKPSFNKRKNKMSVEDLVNLSTFMQDMTKDLHFCSGIFGRYSGACCDVKVQTDGESPRKFEMELSCEIVAQIQAIVASGDGSRLLLERLFDAVAVDIKEKLFEIHGIKDVARSSLGDMGQKILLEANMYLDHSKSRKKNFRDHFQLDDGLKIEAISRYKTAKTYCIAILAWDEQNFPEKEKGTIKAVIEKLIESLQLFDPKHKSGVYKEFNGITKNIKKGGYSKLQEQMVCRYDYKNAIRQRGRYFSYPLFF